MVLSFFGSSFFCCVFSHFSWLLSCHRLLFLMYCHYLFCFGCFLSLLHLLVISFLYCFFGANCLLTSMFCSQFRHPKITSPGAQKMFLGSFLVCSRFFAETSVFQKKLQNRGSSNFNALFFIDARNLATFCSNFRGANLARKLTLQHICKQSRTKQTWL